MQFAFFCGTIVIFQSTSPYAGDDTSLTMFAVKYKHFNPRPPTRGTTTNDITDSSPCSISIHVPLRGGRLSALPKLRKPRKFQSTSPYAGDDFVLISFSLNQSNFNPRPPTRGTTGKSKDNNGSFFISIHVPLRGGRRCDIMNITYN